MNQQGCRVWCFAHFFISFISKRILPLFNAYPSFIQHPSITRIRRIGEIILKANVDFPRSFFGIIKAKKHDHKVVPCSCFLFCGKEAEGYMRIPHLFLIQLLTLFFALVTIKLSIKKEQSSMSAYTRVSKLNFFDWQSHVE
jgi:hypothetical protein